MADQRLVGRDADLGAAADLLARLESGTGGLLLITGEPGIGKTALAEAVLQLAGEAGARTAWATAWQHAGAPPLWPWIQLLRRLGASTDVLDPVGEANPDEADAARFRQFDAVARVLDQQVADGPVVLVLDDLHWADVATLRLLAFVVDATRTRPLLVVGTCRPEETDVDELLGLERLGVRMPLTGLDADAVREVLAETVAALSGEAAGVVAARSAGNPLFVHEFARLLAAAGRVDVAEGAVPPAVAAVIQRRLARLPDRVVGILQGAAVLGRRHRADDLRALLGTEVADGLDIAVAAGVLRREHRDLAFTHDLVLDVVGESMPPARSAALHARAVDLLAERAAQDPSLSAQVATHAERAGRDAEAAAHWRTAAQWALGLLAYEEAADCFARARRLAGPGVPVTDLLLAEADARLRAGELGAARALFADAATQAGRAGEVHRLAAAVLGMGAGVSGWEVPLHDAGHIRLVEETLALVPPDDLRLRSALLARLSVARATPESLAESRALAGGALELAVQAGDPALEAQALAALCDAGSGPSSVRERLALAERIVALGAEGGDRGAELLGRRFLVVATLELGDLAAADRHIAEFDRLAGALRQPLVTWYVPLFRGMRALLRGHLDEARRFQAEVAALAERTGSVNAFMLGSTLRIGIDAQSGGTTPAGLFHGLVDIDPASWASYAAGEAFLALQAGDAAEAARLLRMHADTGFVRLGEDAEFLPTIGYFGRVAAALGEQDAAALLLDRLTPYAGLWVVDGIAAVCWGPVDAELGRLAAALGRVEEARAHLERARQAAVAAGAPLVVAQVEEQQRALGVRRPPAPAERRSGAWLREGPLWALTYAGTTVRLRDAKGLADLARLLARPGQEVHVLDLVAEPGTLPVAGDLGEALDGTARRAYRERLAVLEEEIDEASLDGDRGRLERARDEREFLVAELAAAVGLGGRARRTGDPAERARKAVTTRLRLAVQRIGTVHPELAAHLRNSVRTGTFCSYQPETPVGWQLTRGDATPDVAPPR